MLDDKNDELERLPCEEAALAREAIAVGNLEII